MTTEMFQRSVLDWFDLHGRKHLPWQNEPTPYRVWVSEIMLQQTQVSTVIPFFDRFTRSFPELSDLAGASITAVLEHWAGLGYYARARNLHRAAQLLMQEHAGHFPKELEILRKLPGIGRSTAGAILSLGYGVRTPILDGNVKRVLTRFEGIQGWPGEKKIEHSLWALAELNTPRERVADFNQAMMDLGATVCTKQRPACCHCPLQKRCEAYRLDLTGSIPAAKPRRNMPVRRAWMLIVADESGRILLQQRPPVGIWGGLLAFPEFTDEAELLVWARSRSVEINQLERLAERRHTFSHFHLDFRPILGNLRRATEVRESGEDIWLDPTLPAPLPSPIRRLLDEWIEQQGAKAAEHSVESSQIFQYEE